MHVAPATGQSRSRREVAGPSFGAGKYQSNLPSGEKTYALRKRAVGKPAQSAGWRMLASPAFASAPRCMITPAATDGNPALSSISFLAAYHLSNATFFAIFVTEYLTFAEMLCRMANLPACIRALHHLFSLFRPQGESWAVAGKYLRTSRATIEMGTRLL